MAKLFVVKKSRRFKFDEVSQRFRLTPTERRVSCPIFTRKIEQIGDERAPRAMTSDRDEKFMRAALVEAKKGLGLTSPNPAVGAVLVIDNCIVAKDIIEKQGARTLRLTVCAIWAGRFQHRRRFT